MAYHGGGFASGVRAGATIGQAYLAGKDRLRQQKQDEKDAVRQQELDQRDAEEHRMMMRTKSLEYEAMQREMARGANEDNRAQTLLRLGLQEAEMNGAISGFSRDELQAMRSFYIDLLNEQDRDLIDPQGDGRRIARMDLMPNGGMAFGVSGGAVQGTQPITANRGTMGEGDNEVSTASIEELSANHFGQRQAFYQKYPEMAGIFEDAERQKALLSYVRDVTRAYAGENDGSMSTERELSTKHSNAMALQDAKSKSALALEGAKEGNRAKARNEDLANDSALEGLRHADRMREKKAGGSRSGKGFDRQTWIAKEFSARVKAREEDSYNRGYSRGDPEYQTDREILGELQRAADMLENGVEPVTGGTTDEERALLAKYL